jgi:AmpD protein
MSLWLDGGWLDAAAHLPSPNFGERPAGEQVSLVVVHNISLPPDEFGGEWVEQFFLNQLDPQAHPYFATIAAAQVSAHFYIRRDGRVIQFVDCDRRAWHAGSSVWCGRENCNDYSVGIELEGSDSVAFADEQYAALWVVLDALQVRYPITHVAGHSDVAPGRKTDPGPFFDWDVLRQRYPTLVLPPKVSA